MIGRMQLGGCKSSLAGAWYGFCELNMAKGPNAPGALVKKAWWIKVDGRPHWSFFFLPFLTSCAQTQRRSVAQKYNGDCVLSVLFRIHSFALHLRPVGEEGGGYKKVYFSPQRQHSIDEHSFPLQPPVGFLCFFNRVRGTWPCHQPFRLHGTRFVSQQQEWSHTVNACKV